MKPHIHGIIKINSVGSLNLLKTLIQKQFPLVVLNFPPTNLCWSQDNKIKYKMIFRIMKIPNIMNICILKRWNALNCKCSEFDPDMSFQTEASTSSQQRVKSRWSQSERSESVSRLRVVFVLSCKDRGWLLRSVKPACYSSVYFHQCASSWWFSVCVCVVLCSWFECFFTTPAPPDRQSGEGEWWLVVGWLSLSPELRSVHLPTGGAGGAPLIMAEERRRDGGHRRSVFPLNKTRSKT